ncbi:MULTISPECIES: AroM family protein [Clostridium]|uniref:AroM family protein n=1 Tax=Clostridium TaxID=1485 RepID=UPI000825EBED|nr:MULTISPECIES: AroM family protein [Clostridium]PJI09282.1 AroM family protein [Clostridium sp. CT7]
MKKVGAITVGQSPRIDVIPEMKMVLGEEIEVIEIGALDGLSKEEINEFKPEEGDYVLVSRLNDGTSASFAEKHIIPRLQNCIEYLEEAGAEIIVFICTGAFPNAFKSNKLLLYPQRLLYSLVPELAVNEKIGVFVPLEKQKRQSYDKWSESGKKIEVVSGSPYDNIEKLTKASIELKEKDVDVIVLDCIGYNLKMKNLIREITGKPVILPRTIVSRVVREMLE